MCARLVEYRPLVVSNSVFAFLLGTVMLTIVSGMNSYVDTWSVQYIKAVAFNKDGSPNEQLLAMVPRAPCASWCSANSVRAPTA